MVLQGDFNDILSQDEKHGPVEHPEWLIQGFREVVTNCGLRDLPLLGYPFTWGKSIGKPNAVEERLDRALATSVWFDIFPNARLSNMLLLYLITHLFFFILLPARYFLQGALFALKTSGSVNLAYEILFKIVGVLLTTMSCC